MLKYKIMKRILFFLHVILTSFFIVSCKEKKETIINVKEMKIKSPIGHTFFSLRINNEDTLIYKPCDANVSKYIVFKDSIFHNWGQEYYMLNVISSNSFSNRTQINTTYKYNNEIPDGSDSLITFQKLNKKIWKINGEIFIDSLYALSIKQVRQPCKDCNNCEDSKKQENLSSLFVINKQWSNHCEQGVDKDNIIFYSSDEIAFGIGSINFICGGTSKQISSNTVEIYLKESTNDYAPNGEVYSNNNVPDEIDFKNCSLTVPVAEVKLINKITAQFKWLGFYDTKKEKRVYLKNPFTNKIEKEPIILKRCDE